MKNNYQLKIKNFINLEQSNTLNLHKAARKNKLCLTVLVLIANIFYITSSAQAQNNVGIGTNTPNAKAILELNANNKGFLAPRMNTTFMNAIAPTATENALLIYNTDSACYHFYNGVAWKNLCQKGIDTAVINKAIKNYLGGVSFTTVINNMLVDSSVTNYAVINNAIVNNITIDSSVINYTTINNAVINNLTVDSSFTNVSNSNISNINIANIDTSITNVATINNATINNLTSDSTISNYSNINNAVIDSSVTNYSQVSHLQGGWGSMDSLQIGGQNIMTTLSDSIKSQAWLLKGNTGTNASTNFLGTTDAQDLVFKTNSIENMRILNTNGNVGIGTTAPVRLLHLNGNYALIMQGTIKSWLLGSSNTGDDFNIWDDGFGAGTANTFRIDNNRNIITSLNGGNVGIGTTTPLAKLHTVGVGSSIYNNGLTVQSPNALQSLDVLPGYVLTNSTPAGLQEDITMTLRTSGSLAGNLAFATGNDERMRLLANGNLGIGTSSPLSLLHLLKNNSGGLGASLIVENRDPVDAIGTQVNIDLACDNTGPTVPNGRILTRLANLSNRASEMSFQTWDGGSLSDRIFISEIGNVGIGTTSPTSKLEVIGNIMATNGALLSNVTSGNGIEGFVDLRGTKATSSRPNLNSWTLYNMNEYGGVESGLSIWEYYDNDNNGAFCNPGDICQTRFHIQNVTGNVGIGTISPTSKLEIQGDIKIVDGTQGVNKVLTSDAAGKASWQAASSGGVPIGSIQAWAKSMPGTPALPVGWVECNGAVLSDVASPYNGQTIPNLNGTSRFLQGAATSGGTGGAATHSHTFTQTGADYAPDASHFTDGSIADPSSNIPPFFNVVWIMRVK